MAQPAISIILVTFNSASVLDRCLSSIARHVNSAEVIVVDNGSEDDSVAIARGHAATHVIERRANLGFGSGVNAGAAVATGELLLVLNPDAVLVEVDQTCLGQLAQTPTTGLRACVQAGGGLGQRSVSPAWSWRAEMHWWMFAWFLLPRELPQPRPRVRGSQPRSINGSAFVARRSEFLSVGGFDERFFLYFEDFDLSRTYRLRGWPVETTRAVVVTHRHGNSSPRDDERMITYALLGLIELAFKTGGARAGEDAATHALRLLRWIAGAAARVDGIPVLGARARKKRASANLVRRLLAGGAFETLPADSYPTARQALDIVARRR